MVRLTAIPYPPLQTTVKFLDDKTMVYAISDYEQKGTGFLCWRSNEGFAAKITDFFGEEKNIIALEEAERNRLLGLMNRIYTLVRTAKIEQSQWYFVDDMLVDVRKSFETFVGPGMLRDLCSKMFRTQDVLQIGSFGDIKKAVLDGKIRLPFIIKPSRFKTIAVGDEMLPLYVRITSKEILGI